MAKLDRHEREMNAALKQIKSYKARGESRWQLDIPLWRLAVEGVAVFAVALFVGFGIAIIFQLASDYLQS